MWASHDCEIVKQDGGKLDAPLRVPEELLGQMIQASFANNPGFITMRVTNRSTGAKRVFHRSGKATYSELV